MEEIEVNEKKYFINETDYEVLVNFDKLQKAKF